MKKDDYRKLYGMAIICVNFFFLSCFGGWVELSTAETAIMPFWQLVVMRAIQLLLPAAAFYGLGQWIRRKGL